ncbi:MAG: hypothetical protein ACREPG_07315, partial [Candidatus Binatia bacterium]
PLAVYSQPRSSGQRLLIGLLPIAVNLESASFSLSKSSNRQPYLDYLGCSGAMIAKRFRQDILPITTGGFYE